tara:strand:- start:757 stop:1116 length:360 start_codon:yes stop_codon:yes gene_type:complete
MPSKKIKEAKQEKEEEFDPIEFLKNLSYDDYVNCVETRELLDNEHFWNYEKKLSTNLTNLYIKYNTQFENNILFNKDPNKIFGVYFADLIYKFIQKKYDVTIFHDNIKLATPLFKLYDK